MKKRNGVVKRPIFMSTASGVRAPASLPGQQLHVRIFFLWICSALLFCSAQVSMFKKRECCLVHNFFYNEKKDTKDGTENKPKDTTTFKQAAGLMII